MLTPEKLNQAIADRKAAEAAASCTQTQGPGARSFVFEPAPGEEAAPTVEERLAVQETRTAELAETKVESAHRLPFRITGMALFNTYLNTNGGGGGAQSWKLGNIAVSPRKLLMTLPAMISSLWLQDHPWAAASIALSLLGSILSKMELQIQEREATVLWAIWLNRDANNRISKEALLAVVNNERVAYGLGVLSLNELGIALALLLKLGCIRDEESSWRVCESVQVEFS